MNYRRNGVLEESEQISLCPWLRIRLSSGVCHCAQPSLQPQPLGLSRSGRSLCRTHLTVLECSAKQSVLNSLECSAHLPAKAWVTPSASSCRRKTVSCPWPDQLPHNGDFKMARQTNILQNQRLVGSHHCPQSP